MLKPPTMDGTRTRQLLIAGGLLIGLPLTLHLWETQFDRLNMGSVARHIERGDEALKEGKYLEAISAYGHARELRPTDASIQQNLMRARASLVAEQPMRITGETAEELRYEANFLFDNDRPRRATYLTVLGNISARTGNTDDARARFESALKADPNSVVAHSATAIYLLNQKDGAEKAKAEFEAVLKAKPDHAVALVGLAQIALADNKPEAAVEKLEAALKLADDFTARMLLGSAKQRLQKNDEAVTQYQRAAQLDPRNAEALRSLGQALLATNKPEEAEKALRASAQLQQDAQTVLALGFALARQNKSDQALGMFSAVLQQNPNDAPAMFGAGTALEGLGKKQDALAIYKKLAAIQVGQNAPGGQLVAQLQQQAEQRMAAIEGRPAAQQQQQSAPAPGGQPPQGMGGAPQPGTGIPGAR